MKKLNAKSKKSKVSSESPEATSTEPVATFDESTITSTNEYVAKVQGIDRLEIGFPNEDMNKVVGKINELIDKSNDSI